MDKKLMFFSNLLTRWRLLFKIFWIGGGLLILQKNNFVWWLDLLFLSLVIYIYLSLLPERKFLRFSFWLLVFGELSVLSFLPWGFISFFSILFFCFCLFFVFGLADLIFKDRFLVYGILNTIVIFLTALLFFYFHGSVFPLSYLVLFLLLNFIFLESLSFFGVLSGKKKILFALFLSFLGTEMAFFLSFLPLGFINAASFLTLFLVLGRDGLVVHPQGFLNSSFVFKELVLFLIIGLVIFSLSTWSIQP